ncbi:hypothetical protein Btru_075509 [Bulinus truncatus]|nr:hypothetical protein Btru_075509 [Bulinus truncatus]
MSDQGWWLSMKKEDNFFERLQPIENVSRLYDRAERFGQYNDKTFGMQVYSDNEPDLLKYQLENLRPGLQLNSLPETKLAKAKKKMEHYEEQKRMIQAMNAFLASLKEHDTDNNDMISRRELLAALSDEKLFPPSEKKIIFGDVDSETIWKCLDKDGNDQFSKFLSSLYETLTTNVDRVYIQEKDLHRTVGINTGYVGTTDFELEKGDVEFLCERGRLSLETFLKSYVALDKERKRLEGPMISSTDGVSSPGKPPAAPSIPSP